jgi:cell division protein FtsI (penicillin-binding protein 3)
MPLTILKKKSTDIDHGERVFSAGVTPKVLEMMESVIQDGGTGQAAQVKGYRVAGKTGTAIKAVAGGYGDDYIGIFAGVAPVSDPRFAVVVMINDPAGDYYHGGEVAAPVFSQIMGGALQLLNVAPDDLSPQQMYARRDASDV